MPLCTAEECRKELPAVARYCPRCGRPVAVAKSSIAGWVALLGIMLLVGFLMVGMLFARQSVSAYPAVVTVTNSTGPVTTPPMMSPRTPSPRPAVTPAP